MTIRYFSESERVNSQMEAYEKFRMERYAILAKRAQAQKAYFQFLTETVQISNTDAFYAAESGSEIETQTNWPTEWLAYASKMQQRIIRLAQMAEDRQQSAENCLQKLTGNK